jgi:hypothetical protein
VGTISAAPVFAVKWLSTHDVIWPESELAPPRRQIPRPGRRRRLLSVLF